MKTILISGKQGTGKTSLVYMLAQEYVEFDFHELMSSQKRTKLLAPILKSPISFPKVIVIDDASDDNAIEHIKEMFKFTDKILVFITNYFPEKVVAKHQFTFVYELKH